MIWEALDSRPQFGGGIGGVIPAFFRAYRIKSFLW